MPKLLSLAGVEPLRQLLARLLDYRLNKNGRWPRPRTMSSDVLPVSRGDTRPTDELKLILTIRLDGGRREFVNSLSKQSSMPLKRNDWDVTVTDKYSKTLKRKRERQRECFDGGLMDSCLPHSESVYWEKSVYYSCDYNHWTKKLWSFFVILHHWFIIVIDEHHFLVVSVIIYGENFIVNITRFCECGTDR